MASEPVAAAPVPAPSLLTFREREVAVLVNILAELGLSSRARTAS
ncbi:hypothetical protein [Streptomyces mirabilis]